MTDKELLEAAARAAGWTGWQSKHGYWNVDSPDGRRHVCCRDWPAFDADTGAKLPAPTFGDAMLETLWNPLTDDGDALRLAVKLRLMVNGVGKVVLDGVHVQSDDGVAMECSGEGQDPYAATRRAIVRAAASIGQSGQAQQGDSNGG